MVAKPLHEMHNFGDVQLSVLVLRQNPLKDLKSIGKMGFTYMYKAAVTCVARLGGAMGVARNGWNGVRERMESSSIITDILSWLHVVPPYLINIFKHHFQHFFELLRIN